MTNSAFDKSLRQPITSGKNTRSDFDLAENTEDLDFLRSLYPRLSNDQILEAKERLDGYFDLALETFLEHYGNRTVDDDQTSS